MKYPICFVLLFVLISSAAFSQVRIDSTFAFQTDPAKQFSVYIPSSYDAAVPSKLMLGLHPWNTSRWNSISWCDTLLAFAEQNDLLMICPDGGQDGQVSQPIDTAFATALLDSMELWYNVDQDEVYAMGFSWGGQVTYTYGLANAWRFKGLMPIGAAINGTSEMNLVLENAFEQKVYIVHGSQDSPNTRYTPAVNALTDEEACLETNLLSGVDHTIDFPNRNAILSDAFIWLDTSSCGIMMMDTMQMDTMMMDTMVMDTVTGLADPILTEGFKLYPNPVRLNGILRIEFSDIVFDSSPRINIYGLNGVQLYAHKVLIAHSTEFEWPLKRAGIYILEIDFGNQKMWKRISVLE